MRGGGVKAKILVTVLFGPGKGGGSMDESILGLSKPELDARMRQERRWIRSGRGLSLASRMAASLTFYRDAIETNRKRSTVKLPEISVYSCADGSFRKIRLDALLDIDNGVPVLKCPEQCTDSDAVNSILVDVCGQIEKLRESRRDYAVKQQKRKLSAPPPPSASVEMRERVADFFCGEDGEELARELEDLRRSMAVHASKRVCVEP